MPGDEIPFEKILVRIPWKDGWRVASYNRDLREAKARERQIREANEQAQLLKTASHAAQVASQVKSEFLARMSHELRTPLNAAIGFLSLALQRELPQETTDNLELSLDACHNLLHLINDILDISKIEAGRFELTNDDYRLADLISEVISFNSFRIDSKSIDFCLKVDENLPSKFRGDDLRIKQVLNNLLSNAFKYTEKGTVTLSIGTKPGAQEQAGFFPVHFSIRDTGRGIKPKSLEKLFTSYTRFDSKANRFIEGTGLGLSISKHLVEMMGGQMHVESKYRKGSVFSFTIPLVVIDPAPLGSTVAHALVSPGAAPLHRRQRHTLRECAYLPYARVLVVDDVPTNLAVAKGMLQRYGMTVDCVAGGQEAVALLSSGKNRYNAIFMDHMMPGMDGAATLRRIRAIRNNHARTVPVIMLTANVIAGNEKKFLGQGFQAFLGKPIEPLKLDAVINKWVKDARQEVRPDSPRRRWNDMLPSGADACPKAAMASAAGIVHGVEGLDMQEAISRFGSKEFFLDVLRSYAASTPDLLEEMRLMTQKDMARYAIFAHGIKGSSYGVGAKVLGDMAKEPERAAAGKDWPKVRKLFPPFLEAAETLLRGIGTLLREVTRELPGEEADKPLKPAPDVGDLAALYKASLSCSHSVMEQHLRQLEQYRYQSGGELVAWLRERVDAFDYDQINERLAEYSS
jgi:signal transduction histidine kinase/FixJ family two-component response regulator